MNNTVEIDRHTLPVEPAEAPEIEPIKRWVKVDVSEETFQLVHDMAAASRMRIMPYLRRFLQEAWSYSTPGESPTSMTYACDRPPRRPVDQSLSSSGAATPDG